MEFKEKKHPRSMRLSAEINRKLEAVCLAIGTNANSYLLNEVGKSVIRDYQAINMQTSSEKAFESINALFAALPHNTEKLKDLSNG
jgi:uncharacterized phage infection (PIP) family protein YhgE